MFLFTDGIDSKKNRSKSFKLPLLPPVYGWPVSVVRQSRPENPKSTAGTGIGTASASVPVTGPGRARREDE